MWQTAVDSRGPPSSSTGTVFSSTPRAAKSGPRTPPSPAPSSRSMIRPGQPLVRTLPTGTGSPSSSASSARVTPTSARAWASRPGSPGGVASIAVTRYLIIAALAACGGSRPGVRAPAIAPAAPEGQVGMATFYAARFAGRPTASGERYDPRALTAAHRSLPLGTVVRVTRLDASGAAVGAPVVVRVNDRGPYV